MKIKMNETMLLKLWGRQHVQVLLTRSKFTQKLKDTKKSLIKTLEINRRIISRISFKFKTIFKIEIRTTFDLFAKHFVTMVIRNAFRL